MANEAPVTLDRKLWLTEDRDRLVEHGDPVARFLFGCAGKRVSGAECKRLKYRPKPKLAADDETAQTVAADAEKARANAKADQAEADRLAASNEDADAASKEAKKIADKERKKAANKGGKKAAKKGGK